VVADVCIDLPGAIVIFLANLKPSFYRKHSTTTFEDQEENIPSGMPAGDPTGGLQPG
jgi:hypothetical protein